jgi:molecular chaperone GrpE
VTSGFDGSAGRPDATADETREPLDGASGGSADPAAGAAEATTVPEGQDAEEGENHLAADLTVARDRVSGLTEDLQRLQAEYVNYKRRVDRDRELVKQNATFSVLAGMLPVLDDLDRAREHGELEGGFKSVADALEAAVGKLGLERFGEPGEPFDPSVHEALTHAHSADVTEPTAVQVFQPGYRIGARVVRPARVGVAEPEPSTES